MFLYNISIIIEETVHQPLLDWIKELLINIDQPELKLLKMLHSPHEGHTYCLQITVSNEDEINIIQSEILNAIQQEISLKYHEKAFLFDSIMQYLPQK